MFENVKKMTDKVKEALGFVESSRVSMPLNNQGGSGDLSEIMNHMESDDHILQYTFIDEMESVWAGIALERFKQRYELKEITNKDGENELIEIPINDPMAELGRGIFMNFLHLNVGIAGYRSEAVANMASFTQTRDFQLEKIEMANRRANNELNDVI